MHRTTHLIPAEMAGLARSVTFARLRRRGAPGQRPTRDPRLARDDPVRHGRHPDPSLHLALPGWPPRQSFA